MEQEEERASTENLVECIIELSRKKKTAEAPGGANATATVLSTVDRRALTQYLLQLPNLGPFRVHLPALCDGLVGIHML